MPDLNEGIESIFHALVQCKVATICWQVFNLGINTERTMNFPVLLERSLTGELKNNKAKIITLCWSIWRSRNDLVWNKKQ